VALTVTARSATWRWGMVGVIILGTVINYLARNSLAVLAPQLEHLQHFGAKEYSYVVGAFQLAYTVMQPVCGRVIDFLGVRAGFALFAVLWSLACVFHAGVNGWQGLAAVRGMLGASEATAIPAGIKVVGEQFQGAERSAAVGWFNIGTSLGAMLAPPLTVFMSLHYGWRAPFVIIGAMGMAWAALWYALYRSPPTLKTTSRKGFGFDVLATRRFWAIAIPRFLAEPAWQTFNFWIPLYLADERHWDIKQIALFAWAPFLAADLGGLAGGYISPILIRLFKVDLIRARIMGMALGAFLMIAPGCVTLVGNPYLAIGLLCIGGFAHQIVSITINTLSVDLFPTDRLATTNGWVGAAGWTGGLLFSLLIGQVVGRTGFGPLFALLAVFDLVGAVVLYIMLRGERSILEETA
jgi:ACS family hexuronate transporter-like MFS transporter